MDLLKIKHSVNSGDLIASIAGLQKVYETKGRKSVIMQRLNMKAAYYQGAVHPVIDTEGNMVSMNEKQWNMLVPLLEAQPYVDHCEVWEGQKFELNFDAIREGNLCNMPNGLIQKWIWASIPSLTCDLSKPWIHVEPKDDLITKDKIVVNLTERYRNPNITYFFLKEYEEHLIFAGTDKEYENFSNEYKIRCPLLKVDNFLELAECLLMAKVFLGNQSFCWNLAEAMKIPRVLELCSFAPNCFSIGPNGYDFFNQQSLEYFIEKIMTA